MTRFLMRVDTYAEAKLTAPRKVEMPDGLSV